MKINISLKVFSVQPYNKTKLALVILFLQFVLGSAVGIQRTIISIFSKSFINSALIAFLPIISFGILKGIVDIVGGIISDKIGRKLSMILGAGVYSIGIYLMISFEGLESLVMGNILIGIGEGLNHIASMTSLSDIFTSEEAATSFGFMEGFAYTGYGVGAIIAGFLSNSYGIRSSFYFGFYASLFAFIFAIFFIKETRYFIRREKRYEYEEITIQKGIKKVFKYPSLVITYLVAHITKLSDSLMWAVLPLFLKSKGIGFINIGLIEGIFIFFWALSMPFWGRLSDRVGRKPIASIGITVNALSILLFLYSNTIPDNIMTAVLLGVSYGMHYPVLPALTTDLAPLGIKATALGIFRGLRDSGIFTGAILLGVLLDFLGIDEAFYIISLLLFMGSALIFAIAKETRPTWPFFRFVYEHVQKIKEIIVLHGEFLDTYLSGNIREAYKINRRIKNIEREADVLKRQIMGKIWASAIPLGDSMDFEKLIETIDRIAGAILECNERIFRVNPKIIDEELKNELLNMNKHLVDVSDKFIENMNALRISPIYALKVSDLVEKEETKVDAIRNKIMHIIRRKIQEEKIDLLSAIDLRDAVDLIELVADDLEDASDIIRIISYKHGV